jgi:hypothetical protein
MPPSSGNLNHGYRVIHPEAGTVPGTRTHELARDTAFAFGAGSPASRRRRADNPARRAAIWEQESTAPLTHPSKITQFIPSISVGSP